MHNTLQKTDFIRGKHTVSLGGEVLKRHFLQRDTQYDRKMVTKCENLNIFIKSRKCQGRSHWQMVVLKMYIFNKQLHLCDEK